MKRKRLILTTVLLACVAAVVMPFSRPLWIAAVYERVEEPAHFYDDVYFLFYEKKVVWLPGADVIVPDQVCTDCKATVHSKCFMKKRDEGVTGIQWGTLHPLYIDLRQYQCTCPDPSHEWNR